MISLGVPTSASARIRSRISDTTVKLVRVLHLVIILTISPLNEHVGL